MKVSVDTTPVDRPDPPGDQLQQVVVALADHLDQEIEGAGGDHDVVDLAQLGQGVGDVVEQAR